MYDFTSPPHFKVLEDIPWLDARIFTAEGGHSLGTYAAPSGAPGLNCAVQGNDNHVAKEMNRGKVAHCFGFEPEKLLTTKEEEDTICIIRVPWNIHSRPRDNSLILSEMFDYVAGILTCDCAPVILADRRNKRAGIIHVGYRQVVNGLVDATVKRMEDLGSRAADIAAVIGPCAGVVDGTYIINARNNIIIDRTITRDRDVKSFFKATGAEATHGPLQSFQMQDYIEFRLKQVGVGEVQCIRLDTMLDPRFYSRKSTPCGLMFSGIRLKRLHK